MEVHRVAVHAVVGDLPDLGLAVLDGVQALHRHVDVGQRDRGRNSRRGEGKFYRQRGVHAAKDRVKQLLNGFVDDGQGFGGFCFPVYRINIGRDGVGEVGLRARACANRRIVVHIRSTKCHVVSRLGNDGHWLGFCVNRRHGRSQGRHVQRTA